MDAWLDSFENAVVFSKLGKVRFGLLRTILRLKKD
jgi:hypothetical protein